MDFIKYMKDVLENKKSNQYDFNDSEKIENNSSANSEATSRLLADFENYRKRADKEKAFAFETGQMSVINHLLDFFDNFELGLNYAESFSKNKEAEEMIKGLKMSYLLLKDRMRQEGLKEIKAEGERFDPALHEAVSSEESGIEQDGIIAREIQKGYNMRSKVVRFAKVSVFKNS